MPKIFLGCTFVIIVNALKHDNYLQCHRWEAEGQDRLECK